MPISAIHCLYSLIFWLICTDRTAGASFDDSSTPFHFPYNSYETVLFGTNERVQQLFPLTPHMGVAEPFGGTPSGDVVFSLLSGPESLSFQLETVKIGKFFFLRIFATHIETDRKHSHLTITVKANFVSNAPFGAASIKLQNTTRIRITVLDRNDNCPFFSSPRYVFRIGQSAYGFLPLGSVSTTDSDTGFNAQAFFHAHPLNESVPLWVHPITGEIHVTNFFEIPNDMWSESKFSITGANESPRHFLKVFASQRGDKSRIRCNIVSTAIVDVDVIRDTSEPLRIIVDPMEYIPVAGVSGAVYAIIKVSDRAVKSGSIHRLYIVQPFLREMFELVPTDALSEWKLQVRQNLSSISLTAKISITVEAIEEESSDINSVGPRQPRKAMHALSLPVVSKSTFRIHFPEEVIISVSEVALANCTVAILVPHVSYAMTNSDFVFTILENTVGDFNDSPFELTPSGAIILRRLLDVDIIRPGYIGENVTRITQNFTVVDRNNLLLSSSANSRLVLLIDDVNDNDPIVRNNASVYEIREDAPIGSIVFEVDAFDPDISQTVLSYVLHNPTNLPFNLSDRGELKLNRVLDAETMPDEFTVYISVSDSGKPLPRHVLAVFTVHIVDVDEYAPMFVERSCDVSLPVSDQGFLFFTSGTSSVILGRYSAEDKDRDGNSNLRILLASSSLPRPCFSVDPSTGQLAAVCPFLGLPNSEIILTLVASDGQLTSDVPCRIAIRLVPKRTDSNNVTQRCEPSGVYEDIQRLKLMRREYESSASYNPAYTTITNRHRPKFPSDLPTRIHVPENLPLGTVILRLTASDEDGAETSFSGYVVFGLEAIGSVAAEVNGLSGNFDTRNTFHQAFLLQTSQESNSAFSRLPKNTADLIVAAPLDRESISSYSLALHVCDLGSPSLCSFSPLQIVVEDLNDNAPEFIIATVEQSSSPALGFEHRSHDKRNAITPGVFAVPEDVPVNELIGQVSAKDRDVSDEIRYRLLSYTDVFNVHPKTGKIRLVRGLDRESQSSYELLIEAFSETRRNYQNGHPFLPAFFRLLKLAEANDRYMYNRSTTTRVVVSVTDVNDNPPIFVSPGYGLSLPVDTSHHMTKFGSDGYELYVPEDMPEGAYLTTLAAVDADDGSNAQVGYSIFGDMKDTECFHVEQLTGVVTLGPTCKLSEYRGQSIYLTAWAFDHGSPQLMSNNSFIIHVFPVHVNVFPPVFSVQPALYFGSVMENAAAGSPVLVKPSTPLRLDVVDPDGAALDLVLVGGSGLGRFSIDEQGIIRTNQMLDAEAVRDEGGYWLTIYAIEHPSSGVVSTESDGPMRALAELFIEVVDENDNYPIPVAPEYRTTVPENSPAGVLVATPTFVDADRAGLPLLYRISAGDPQGHFTIDLKTGAIHTTARPLNREAIVNATGTNLINLVVTATDQGSPPKTGEVRVLVTVQDENDQTPTFVPLTLPDSITWTGSDAPFYHLRIYEAEQDPFSGCVGRVFAVDLDDGSNGTVVYWHDTIADSTYPTGDFQVDATSGLVCSDASPLAVGHYQIQVFAKDLGQPPRFANENRSVIVVVSVLPAPSLPDTGSVLQFTRAPPKQLTVQSVQPCGQELFSFALSNRSNPDGRSLTYLLTSANGSQSHPFGLRQLSATEGSVFLAQALNAGQLMIGPAFQLILTVSNGYNRLVAKTRVLLLENSSRTDDHLSFALNEFANGSTVANLSIIALPHTADESHGPQHPGAASLLVRAQLSEETPVGSLVCVLKTRNMPSDATPVVDYTIASVGQAVTRQLFNIHHRSGEIRVIQPLDHEATAVHDLLVSVRHGTTSAFIAVQINVSDANEHSPQFVLPQPFGSTAESVSENLFTFYCVGTSAVGTVVGRVVAFDPDSGENGRLTYTIVGGEAASYFAVDPSTGDLRIAKKLLPVNTAPSYSALSQRMTRPWTSDYRLLVSVSDGGRPVPRSNHTTVSVRIVPGPGGVDIPGPRFRVSVAHLTLMENCPAGHAIAPLSRFLTRESDVMGFVRFELVRAEPVSGLVDGAGGTSFRSTSAKSDLFFVVPHDGLLLASVRLDRERHGELHRLLVRAVGLYGVRAHLTDYLTIEIHIMDENDNSPVIISPKLIFGRISEDAIPGTAITTVDCSQPGSSCDPTVSSSAIRIRATDADLGLNSQLNFQFVGPHAGLSKHTFRVDPITGRLSLAPHATLDRESQSHYTLFIQISDSGSPARTADNLIRVEVEVVDVNDCAPAFKEGAYIRTLVLPTHPSELISQVHASDPDLDDVVSYRFVNDRMRHLFELDSTTGQLRVAPNSTLLDTTTSWLTERTFLVELEAYDSAMPRPHVSRTNVTIFTQVARFPMDDQTVFIIDPEGGLDVSVVEHYSGPEPLRLGQLTVRNAPVGVIFTFMVSVPIPGLEVDRFTGVVWATGDQHSRALDRERTPLLSMDVLVRGPRNQMARTTVRVRLLDINDHTPSFINEPYYTSLCLGPLSVERSRSEQIGSCSFANFSVSAVDEDEGANSSVTYSLASLRPRSEPPAISVDATSGQLALSRPLPPDWAGRQLEAVVLATDGGGLSATATVIIHLVSEAGPKFSASYYTVAVPESTQLGEAITTMDATSPNPLASLVYRIVHVLRTVNGTDTPQSTELAHSPFLVEFNTGIIRLVKSLDYEVANSYLLLLEVLDTSTGLMARVYLSVTVIDVNDVAPQFPVPSLTVHVSEHEAVGYVVLRLEATDPDSGLGGQVSYSLEPHTVEGGLLPLSNQSVRALSEHFHCDPSTGRVTLARRLDYEESTVHRFWAVVTDQAPVPLSSRIPVTVHVLDSNNNAPVFELPSTRGPLPDDCLYTLRLHERTDWGGFVGRVHATDADRHDTLEYRLLNSPSTNPRHADHFRLGLYDGVLRWAPYRTMDGRLGSPSSYRRRWTDSSSSWFRASALEELRVDTFKLQVIVSDGLHTARCNVHVQLESANYVAPTFPTPKHVQWNVTESTTELGHIPSAMDGDHGTFGRIRYSLVGGFHRDRFRLSEMTGDLHSLEPLDREKQDRYELLVRATDGGERFDHMLLAMNVIDSNDNGPRFLQKTYAITLFPTEYSPAKARLPLITTHRVRAIDADLGSNARLHYRLFRPPTAEFRVAYEKSASLFDIDPSSGRLIVKSPVPGDLIGTDMRLFVEACDSPTGEFLSTLCSHPAQLTIHLATQSPGVVPRIGCTASPVLEDDRLTERDVAFCGVSPTNVTGTWAIGFILCESRLAPASLFRIDPATGHVFATKPMDYELGRVYELGIEYHVDNGGTAGRFPVARTSLTIELVDTNDCVPELDSQIYTVRVPEDLPVDTRLLRVFARDRDADNTDPVSYSLWPSSVLDAELARHPVLDASNELAHWMRVLSSPNPEVLLLRKQFHVDSLGWISISSPLDFESSRIHEFKVVVMDSVGHWNSSLVVVHVLDVNDNAPHWPVRPSPNDSLDRVLYPDVLKRQTLHAHVHHPENHIPDAPIYQLQAYDPDLEVNDSSSITFYLLPDLNTATGSTYFPSSAFISVLPTGEVWLRRPLDRELVANYTLRFLATDGLFVTKDVFTLLLTVDDVNDHAPICFEPIRHLTVSEDTPVGSVLTQLVAEDADAELANSQVTYTLTHGDQAHFTVDPVTGHLALNHSLDFETARSHTVQAQASDPSQLGCRFAVTFSVVDVNDNPPVFEPVSISPIPEDAPIGSLVGKVTARDPDLVDANRLTYSLQTSHESSFGIEPQTGLLKVIRTLDRETKSVHSLVARVTDGSRPSGAEEPFTATASFSVRILDVNDSPPQFLNTSAHRLRISELAPIGTNLLRLNAVSLDEGNNSVVRYKLLTSQPEFGLNETTGDLVLEGSLDHERVSSYFLTIEARDHGSPPLSATAVVTVTVEDENDHSPELVGQQPVPATVIRSNDGELPDGLLERYYSFSVAENSRPGTVVGRVKAIDADSGENGRLEFHLPLSNTSDWIHWINATSLSSTHQLLSPDEARQRFHVHPDSGQVSVLFEPDRESVEEFWFEAAVSDHGSPNRLTNRTLICVRVLDINDCAPSFEKSYYEFVVEVDRSGNVSGCQEIQPVHPIVSRNPCKPTTGGRVLIGRLRLSDADADPNAGPFTCQLTHSGNVQTAIDLPHGSSLFFVRNGSSNRHNTSQSVDDTRVGECLLYAMDRLPVGSQSLVLRANDNGLTSLHTSVTLTVRVVRLANLPPEIVLGNMTMTYYRGTRLRDLEQQQQQPSSDPMVHSSIRDALSTLVVGRVTVKDRTAHDRLSFELLPDGSSRDLFRVDPYDGAIRPAFPSAGPEQYDPSQSGAQRNPAGQPFDRSAQSVSLDQLDSGVYPIRVRVTNGSLSSEETLHIQIVVITDEMLDSSAIIRIPNLLPNLFYMEKYDQRLRSRLASLLLKDHQQLTLDQSDSVHSAADMVHILSVQEGDAFPVRSASSSHRRPSRSLDRAVDVLVAVYDKEQREFIQPQAIADAVSQASDALIQEFGGQLEVITDVCTTQFCPRGRCVTRPMLDLRGLVNRVEVHRVTQVSPRFLLQPTCQCPDHFTGLRCDVPTNGCSLAACPAPRICVPQGTMAHDCVCPPPRTGPNCESVQPVGHKDACYTERCFVERETGPLQFSGGSFIHWEIISPNPHHFKLSFSLRTRQSTGVLAAIRWNALQAFQLRLATEGRLVVSPVGLKDGLPSADWLVSAEPVSDGYWHRFQLILTNLHADKSSTSDFLPFQSTDVSEAPNKSRPSLQRWWIELTVDGIHPRSASIEWSPGDPVQQSVLLGADPVQGFRPLSPARSLSSAPVLGHWPPTGNTTASEMTILRSGVVGCIRDVRIGHQKPPYQVNQHIPPLGVPSEPVLVLARTHQLVYGCDPALTVSGPCSTGPCLHGGRCALASRGSTATGSYVCHCPALFHGHHCERTNDACLLNPCQNGGRCQTLSSSTLVNTPANSGLAAYRCVCPVGVSGLNCETMHHDLAPAHHRPGAPADGPDCRRARLILQAVEQRPNTAQSSRVPWESPVHAHRTKDEEVCLNAGQCVDSPTGLACSCPGGWQGARCEHDVDECQLSRMMFAQQTMSSHTTVDSVRSRRLQELYGSHPGGLCSPYEAGRGVCVNTPGSYHCNCSLGFTGRHCQTKNLVPLTPDPNALGLTQLHVYIIVGLLVFLFLSAMIAIILLACRARGLLAGSFDGEGRPVKPNGPVMWSYQNNQMQKPPSHGSDSQFFRYNHSEASSLAGVPFLTSGPSHGLPPLVTHPSCHGFPSAQSARRPSCGSSTFAVPSHTDDSTVPLLVGPGGNMHHGSCSSAAMTSTDLPDHDDASVSGASRLVLYPTASGDAIPLVMMVSPRLTGSGSTRSVNSRACVMPRYSPASSVMFTRPVGLSGSVSPIVNYGNGSAFVAYHAEAPGSACIPPRHAHANNPTVAFMPFGAHQTFFAQPTQAPFTPGFGMRPGSLVGSDRLSLGSGSDRFSVQGSQILVPPNGVPPQSTGQYLSTQNSASVESFIGSQQPPHSGLSELVGQTIRPDPNRTPSRSNLAAECMNGPAPDQPHGRPGLGFQRSHPDYRPPRPPIPNSLHLPNSSDSVPTLCAYSLENVATPTADGDLTPTLHKTVRPKPVDAPADVMMLRELRTGLQDPIENGVNPPVANGVNDATRSHDKMHPSKSPMEPTTENSPSPELRKRRLQDNGVDQTNGSDGHDSDTLRAPRRQSNTLDSNES